MSETQTEGSPGTRTPLDGMTETLMEWVEVGGIQYATQQEVAHEIERLRKPPEETLSDEPGCAHCMRAGTPVRLGEVCPKCGDRLPTRTETEQREKIAQLTSALAAETAARERAERRWHLLRICLRSRDWHQTLSRFARNNRQSVGVMTEDRIREIALDNAAYWEIGKQVTGPNGNMKLNKQIERAIRQALSESSLCAETVERCAKVCESTKQQMRFGDMERAADICADAIRSLPADKGDRG